jgi:hypothetical protein
MYLPRAPRAPSAYAFRQRLFNRFTELESTAFIYDMSHAAIGSETAMARIRVALACTPGILQDVLGILLEQRSDVELVAPEDPSADVVLVSFSGEGPGWPQVWPRAGRSARRVVGIDPVRLRVCVLEQRQGRVIHYEIDAYVASIINTLAQPLHEPAVGLADAG